MWYDDVTCGILTLWLTGAQFLREHMPQAADRTICGMVVAVYIHICIHRCISIAQVVSHHHALQDDVIRASHHHSGDVTQHLWYVCGCLRPYIYTHSYIYIYNHVYICLIFTSTSSGRSRHHLRSICGYRRSYTHTRAQTHTHAHTHTHTHTLYP